MIIASRSLAFLALGVSAILISLYLLFPVKEIQVEGNHMLPKSAILQGIPDRTSLPMIGSSKLERRVDSNPWVKGVDVNKDWNSGMVVVKVKERDAALNARLTDGKKVVLAEDGTMLPGLGGASLKKVEVDRVRLEEIRKAQKVLEENGIEVGSVESVDADGVKLSLHDSASSQPVAIFSGEVGGGQARVLKGLLHERPDVKYYDLRTPGRVVVGRAPGAKAANGKS